MAKMPQRICRQVVIVLVLFVLSGGRAEQRTKRAVVNQTVGTADLGHATQERHGEQGHVGGGVHGGHGHGGHDTGAHGGIHLASWRWEEYSNHVMFTGNGVLRHKLVKFSPFVISKKRRYSVSGVHSIMMVNSVQTVEGRDGVHSLLPFHSIYHDEQSCDLCTLQLRGQIHSSYFSSTLFSSVVLRISRSTKYLRM